MFNVLQSLEGASEGPDRHKQTDDTRGDGVPLLQVHPVYLTIAQAWAGVNFKALLQFWEKGYLYISNLDKKGP